MANEDPPSPRHEPGHDRHPGHEDRTLRAAVKILAVPMVRVIVRGLGDVVHVLYRRLAEAPFIHGTAAVVPAPGVPCRLITRKT